MPHRYYLGTTDVWVDEDPWSLLYSHISGHYSSARTALSTFIDAVDLDLPNGTCRFKSRDGYGPDVFYLESPNGKRRSGPRLVKIYDRLTRDREW